MFFLLIITLMFLLTETVATTLPLFLIGVSILLVLYRVKHTDVVFVLAFLGGLILDANAVRNLGGTSLFLVCWLFLILLYQRKYEVDTVPFIVVSSFFGTFSYLWLFGYSDIFIQSIAGSLLSAALFFLFRGRVTYHQEELRFNNL